MLQESWLIVNSYALIVDPNSPLRRLSRTNTPSAASQSRNGVRPVDQHGAPLAGEPKEEAVEEDVRAPVAVAAVRASALAPER